MKKVFILPLLFLMACKPDNPEPNTSTNNGSGSGNNESNLPCEDISWNQSVNYGTVTDIDGNEYKTVTIGNQEWMAENLKTTHYANGDDIPYVFNGNLEQDSDWENLTSGAYCWFFEEDEKGDTLSYECFGGLYNFYVVEDSRNVCPTGWHTPNIIEWTELTDYLATNGHSGTEGTALKSSSGWSNIFNGQNGTGGTDDYGFRALPGGPRDFDGAFDSFGYSGEFWSSTESSSSFAWRYGLGYNGEELYKNYLKKVFGLSIRCIKD